MQFFKLSGAGNDFLGLVEPERTPGPAEIAAWCRRGVSLGADGLFVLRRHHDGAVTMDYFNADGLPAALCLNGTRCAARLAFALGWGSERVRIQTGAGEVIAEPAVHAPATEIALHAPLPDGAPVELRLELPPRADAAGATVTGQRVFLGVPHFVIECPRGVEEAPVAEQGPPIRHHHAFAPAGTNVHFVAYREHGLDIRSWERGVEAETLACGSGVLAAAAVGLALRRCALPLQALTHGGFRLGVDGTLRSGQPESWRLTGDARVVARGELLPGATVAPAPGW
jgi:diaminopimelate epimerase